LTNPQIALANEVVAAMKNRLTEGRAIASMRQGELSQRRWTRPPSHLKQGLSIRSQPRSNTTGAPPPAERPWRSHGVRAISCSHNTFRPAQPYFLYDAVE
jgi:hypothetical protein